MSVVAKAETDCTVNGTFYKSGATIPSAEWNGHPRLSLSKDAEIVFTITKRTGTVSAEPRNRAERRRK